MRKGKNSETLSLEIGIMAFILMMDPDSLFRFPNKDWASPKILNYLYRFLGLDLSDSKLTKKLNKIVKRYVSKAILEHHADVDIFGDQCNYYWRGENFMNHLNKLVMKCPGSKNRLIHLLWNELVFSERMGTLSLAGKIDLIRLKNASSASADIMDVHNHDKCILVRSLPKDYLEKPFLEDTNIHVAITKMIADVGVKVDGLALITVDSIKDILEYEEAINRKLDGIADDLALPLPKRREVEIGDFTYPDTSFEVTKNEHWNVTMTKMLSYINLKIAHVTCFYENLWDASMEKIEDSRLKITGLSDKFFNYEEISKENETLFLEKERILALIRFLRDKKKSLQEKITDLEKSHREMTRPIATESKGAQLTELKIKLNSLTEKHENVLDHVEIIEEENKSLRRRCREQNKGEEVNDLEILVAEGAGLIVDELKTFPENFGEKLYFSIVKDLAGHSL